MKLKVIAEIIGIKKTKENWDNNEEEWTTKAREELYWLHREMLTVLQIILATGQIKEGRYIKEDEYDYELWKETGA